MDARQLYDTMLDTWEEMKSTNDQAIKEAKRLIGGATAETTARVNRLNGELNDRLDAIEKEVKRPRVNLAPSFDYAAIEKKHAFIEACKRGYDALPQDQRDLINYVNADGQRVDVKTMIMADDTLGGFLVPEDLANQIIRGVVLYSPIREVAAIRQTSARSVLMPVKKSGTSAQWVKEAGGKVETGDLIFGREEVPVHECYALIVVSEQDLEDSGFDLEGEITRDFTEQFGVAEGLAFVSGDGNGKPRGILTDLQAISGTPQIKNSADSTGHKLLADDLITLSYDLADGYARNATWLMHRNSVGFIRTLKSAADGQYLWQPGLQAGEPDRLLGRPVLECPDIDQLTGAAGKYAVYFGDFSRGYAIIDRIGIAVRRLVEHYATSSQIGFIGRKRVGGQVILPEAIRVLKTI